MLEKNTSELALGFGLELLAIDFIFSVEPVAVCVGFAVVAVFYGSVAVAEDVVGGSPLVF
jgi:hypothetical protein